MTRIASGLCLVSVLFLVGCGIFPAKFDSTEYGSLVRIESMSEQGQCTPEYVQRMKDEVVYVKHYAHHTPNNEETYESIKLIDESIDTLLKRVQQIPVTPLYCTMKMQYIQTETRILLDAVGKKPR